MNKFTILKFDPVLKSVVWGGRRLESCLGRSLPSMKPYGESWEIVDLPSDQSNVSEGPLMGASLGALRDNFQESLLGRASLLDGRFPLLFKFIDAAKTLSVQVHPNEESCKQIGKGARPKTEAWFIIDSKPGAVLYVGFKPGVSKDAFQVALNEGTVEKVLYQMPVNPGDFVFLPAGTVHAIGAGVLLAEVQQSSSTTYRVFDWNRMGMDGKPRQLHLKEAITSLNYAQVGPPKIVSPESGRKGLVCPSFKMELLDHTESSAVFSTPGPLVLMGVAGAGRRLVSAGGHTAYLGLGQSLMVPACLAEEVLISSEGLLDCLVTTFKLNKGADIVG